MKKNISKRKKYGFIIFVSVIITFSLYGAGVLSGLYANRLIKQNTEKELEEVNTQIDQFRDKIHGIQVQQNFFNYLEEDCDFSLIYLDYVFRDLDYFWNKFPYRIEEDVFPEYSDLKKEYSFLAIQAWMISSQYAEVCSSDLIPVLYLYGRDCSQCVQQGEILDELKIQMQSENKEVLVFAIDLDLNKEIISPILDYYNVSTPPILILNGDVLEGDIFNETKIKAKI